MPNHGRKYQQCQQPIHVNGTQQLISLLLISDMKASGCNTPRGNRRVITRKHLYVLSVSALLFVSLCVHITMNHVFSTDRNPLYKSKSWSVSSLRAMLAASSPSQTRTTPSQTSPGQPRSIRLSPQILNPAQIRLFTNSSKQYKFDIVPNIDIIACDESTTSVEMAEDTCALSDKCRGFVHCKRNHRIAYLKTCTGAMRQMPGCVWYAKVESATKKQQSSRPKLPKLPSTSSHTAIRYDVLDGYDQHPTLPPDCTIETTSEALAQSKCNKLPECEGYLVKGSKAVLKNCVGISPNHFGSTKSQFYVKCYHDKRMFLNGFVGESSVGTPARVVIKGERNSGTTWVRELLKTNFKLMPFLLKSGLDVDGMYGWKHGVMSPRDRDRWKKASNDKMLVIVRDIFPWLQSMYKKSYTRNMDPAHMTFSQFIRASYTYGCESKKKDGTNVFACDGYVDASTQPCESANNFIRLRTAKYRSWTTLPNMVVVRYEDLLENAEEILRSIYNEMSDNIVDSVAPPVWEDVSRHTKSNRKFKVTTRHDALTKYSIEDIAFVRREMDLELETSVLGYDFGETVSGT